MCQVTNIYRTISHVFSHVPKIFARSYTFEIWYLLFISVPPGSPDYVLRYGRVKRSGIKKVGVEDNNSHKKTGLNDPFLYQKPETIP